MVNKIRLAGIVKESIVDGFGIRYVVFTQGCKHNCYGCHNKNTHSLTGGYIEDIDSIINDIKSNKMLDGVTLTGGEPFLQVDECIELSKRLKEDNINIICYTGFLFEELINDKKYIQLVKLCDFIIDGKFIMELKNAYLPFRGSDNQRIIDVKKSLQTKNTVILDDLNKY